MAKKRQTYTEEFKLEAVQQWQNSGKSAADVAEDLGISKGSLYKWKRELGDELGPSSVAPEAEQPEEADSETATADEPSITEAPEPSIQTEDDESTSEDMEEKTEEAEAGVEDEDPEAEAEAAEEDPKGSEEEVEVTEEGQEKSEEESSEVKQIVTAAAVVGNDELSEKAKEEQTKSSGAKMVFKRIAGALGVLFGAIGILLSLAVIIGAWVINTPVTETGLEILVAVEESLNVANNGLDIADETLVEVRNVLAEAREVLPTEELAGRIGDIRGIIDAAQATADTAGSFVAAANSIPFLRGGESEEQKAVTTLSEASTTLSEISSSLESVEQELLDRAEGNSGLISEIETRVANIQALVQNVDQSVTEATAAVVQLQQDLPGLIDTISIIFTLFFFWFGVAQLSLLLHGWQWLRWP